MKKILIIMSILLIMGPMIEGFAQEKPRLGVLRFTNQVAGTSFWRWNNTVGGATAPTHVPTIKAGGLITNQ